MLAEMETASTVVSIDCVNTTRLTLAFTIAYLLRILYSPSSSNDATQALTMVHETLPMMERVGFQNDIVSASVSLQTDIRLKHSWNLSKL